MERTEILAAQIREGLGRYPFHMPGHKRRLCPAGGLPYAWDITEISGMDDLHNAQTILKDAMERSRAVFGGDRLFYLVGGSTLGILAGIYALAPRGSKILAARNCHKSVWHAAEILDLETVCIEPETDPHFGTAGPLSPDAVEPALSKHPDARALVLPSPTYDGVVSDIRRIADVCHRRNVPVLADAAHGAHLGLFERDYFPDSAADQGADISVISCHKTLPSLTQTAMLLVSGSLVDPEVTAHALDLFETSSPSYPLMASLDGCTGIVRERGEALFADWRRNLEAVDAAAEKFRKVRILGRNGERAEDRRRWFDPSKIVICGNGFCLDGRPASGAVLEEFFQARGIEPEMHAGDTVTMLTGLGDTDEGFALLLEALEELDERLEPGGQRRILPFPAPLRGVSPAEAVRLPAEEVRLPEAAGRTAAGQVIPYPPGIPAILPGEIYTEELIEALLQRMKSGDNVIIQRERGVWDAPEERRVPVLVRTGRSRECGKENI